MEEQTHREAYIWSITKGRFVRCWNYQIHWIPAYICYNQIPISEYSKSVNLTHVHYLFMCTILVCRGLFVVCWSLTSLCHSNGHIETMPAREINPFTALTRIRSQFLRTQWSTSNHNEWTRLRIRPLSHRSWLVCRGELVIININSDLVQTHALVTRAQPSNNLMIKWKKPEQTTFR